MTDFRPGRFQVLPVIVKNLIIINVLLVLIQFVLGQRGINLGDYLGLHYWASPKFHWWQFVTHMFMHGDPYDVQGTILHIFSNMFALWMFGSTLENLWGPKRFLTFYLICGVGAALCYTGVLTLQYTNFANDIALFRQHPTTDQLAQLIKHHSLNPGFKQLLAHWQANPDCSNCVQVATDGLQQHYQSMINEGMVGASGAVMGILFAFGYLFPNTLLYVYFFVPLKAKWFVAIYAVFELYAGINQSPGDNIAHFAHLGGMLFAFILLRIWKRKQRNSFY